VCSQTPAQWASPPGVCGSVRVCVRACVLSNASSVGFSSWRVWECTRVCACAPLHMPVHASTRAEAGCAPTQTPCGAKRGGVAKVQGSVAPAQSAPTHRVVSTFAPVSVLSSIACPVPPLTAHKRAFARSLQGSSSPTPVTPGWAQGTP